MERINSSLNGEIALNQMRQNMLDKVGKAGEAAGTEEMGKVLGSFGETLKTQMEQINALQQNADAAVNTYAVGGPIELHNVVLAVEKADMAMQLAVQVRNKLISAYQELSHMQI